MIKVNPEVIEALDIAIANKDNQHTQSQVESLKKLKQQLLTATTISQWADVINLFLRIIGVCHHLPPDN